MEEENDVGAGMWLLSCEKKGLHFFPKAEESRMWGRQAATVLKNTFLKASLRLKTVGCGVGMWLL